MIFTFLVPIMAAGAIMIAGIGICAKCPRAKLGWMLAGLHSGATGLVLVPAIFGKGFPDIPFDDVYMPFMIYPGWPVWALCDILMTEPLKTWLFSSFSPHVASFIGIVWIPAVATALFGSPLWFLVGSRIERIRTRTANRVPVTD